MTVSAAPPSPLPHPSAGRFIDRVHELDVRVYYEDTDFTGVVYHANYLRYFERGRSDFLRLAGIGHAELWARPDPLAFVVGDIRVRYGAPAQVDDALVVRTLYQTIRGARLEIDQTLVRGSSVLAEAKIIAACVNAEGRPRRAPQDLLTLLSPYLEQRSRGSSPPRVLKSS
ncbi:MAG: YbgC/FadM family acyl-CoA thioesterase [Maricaulaceae bacterium]